MVGWASRAGRRYGYVQYPNGTFTTYMAPNAVDTVFFHRNSQGITVGLTTTTQYHNHGLVVSGSSTASVDYPGATDTTLSGINYWGSIVGTYTSNSKYNGFMLKNGVFTRIHYPAAISTFATGINDKGTTIGSYVLGSYNHGFTLANGIYKTLDNPKSLQANEGGTTLADVNGSGVIVGNYFDRVSQTPGSHAFIYINGTFKDIIVPNGMPTFTSVSGINDSNYVTGNTTMTDTGIDTAFTAHCQ